MYPINRLVLGTYKRTCDVCGFDFLRIQLTKRWDGLIVCSKCYLPKPLQEIPWKMPTRKPPILD